MTNVSKTVLYTGVTNDLRNRIGQHKEVIDEKSFTARYGIRYLLYFEEYRDIADAIAREKEIKGWRREKKERLIKTINPYWRFLNEEM